MNKGVVLLSGSADSMSDHLVALNVAGKVAGVRRVESEVKAETGPSRGWADGAAVEGAGAAGRASAAVGRRRQHRERHVDHVGRQDASARRR